MTHDPIDASMVEAQASELFDRLYDAFGRQHWPLAALNIATAAFMDMVFKSTLLDLWRAGGGELECGRIAILTTLDRLRLEIAEADGPELEQARRLFEGLRNESRDQT